MSDTELREKADALIAFTQLGTRFIAWVQAVTDALDPEPAAMSPETERVLLSRKLLKSSAPAPEKVKCPNCGDPVGRERDHYSEGSEMDMPGFYCLRQQPAQGRKVEFPKGRELVSMVRSLTTYLSQLGYTDLARSFNDYADASATELDAAEGKGEGRG